MSELVEGVGPGFRVRLDGPSDGRRVLLLHGFPQDAGSWDLVVDRLAGAGMRCARYDQRGYQASVRPTAVADYVLPLLVDDASAVLTGLGWPDATVVGHDWGAVVAWTLAASRPEQVERLVAVSVPHPVAYAQALQGDEDQQQRSAYIGLLQMAGKAEDVLLADGAAALRAVYTGLPADVVERYVDRFSDRPTLTAALAWYRAMDLETMAAVAPVTVPTRFVWGADDVAVGRVAAEGCAASVTGDYRLVELAGVGHWVPELVPDVLVEAAVGR